MRRAQDPVGSSAGQAIFMKLPQRRPLHPARRRSQRRPAPWRENCAAQLAPITPVPMIATFRNWLGIRTYHSPLRGICGVCDAGEISLGGEKHPLLRPIEFRRIERTWRNRSLNMRLPGTSSAMPIPSIRSETTICGTFCAGFASMGERFTVLPRGGLPRSVQ